MFSGSKRLIAIAVFIIVVIVLVNAIWWLYYDRTQTMMDRQLSRRLAAVAHSGTVAIKPEQVEALELGDFDAYADILTIIDKLRQADSLAEVFVIAPDYRILASTSLEADSIYFLAELNGQYVDSVLYSLHDVTVATPSYRTGRVYLKSAFAPLVGPDGLIVAALGVEANVDYFDVLDDLKNNIYYSSLLSIIGGLVIGLVFLLFQRHVNRVEQQLYLNQTHSYLGRMVAVVSHEIKNPLMIIRASAERLLKKFQTDESQFIVEEVDRLNQIVTGYLDFAGAKSRFLENDKPQTVNLAEMVENIKKHFQSKYPDNEIRWLDYTIDPGLTIQSYSRSLRQIILNLLINGADACLSASKSIEIGVSAEQRNSRIIIKVVDHGPGISKKELKKIFTPFYTTKQTGSGLGLYLTKKIVEEMKGVVDIASRKGEKTELIINLPKTPDKNHG
ncbi:MAG: HAMP domain-containing sensor histidine kinase [Candidatus Zixiibacteriota bacterium]